MKKTVLGVDVGAKRFGVAFYNANDPLKSFSYGQNTVSKMNFEHEMSTVIGKFEPNVVVVGAPTRFGHLIASHNQYIGILMLVCEYLDTQLQLTTDSECRSILFKGINKKAKLEKKKIKLVAHEMLGDEYRGDPDGADAWIMAKAWSQKINN